MQVNFSVLGILIGERSVYSG